MTSSLACRSMTFSLALYRGRMLPLAFDGLLRASPAYVAATWKEQARIAYTLRLDAV